MVARHFAFAFDPVARVLLAVIGITPSRSGVTVDERELRIRFGPWSLRTPLSNVERACVTGPYLWVKAIGPRGSAVDHGVTFGTNHRGGVCVLLREPVGSLLGPDRLLHPGVTVTVEDPQRFADVLRAAVAHHDPDPSNAT